VSFATYNKLNVACELLEVALRLFFEEKEYFAVINLAGAAEELLGAHLKAKGDATSLEELVEGAQRISTGLSGQTPAAKDIFKVANYPRNASKRMNDSSDATMRVYPKRDAKQFLDRAVDNYHRLMLHHDCELQETELVRRFSLYQVSGLA
jgi:hypothetical protein